MHPALALIVLLVAFYFLAKIVDEYFIKSLDNIITYLKLPSNVAGATFMAAGTSAPELTTTLFALFLAGANPATGLGTVVGSAIFQILVVIGFTAVVKTSYLDWKPVIRDGVMYSISVLMLIWVIWDGAITQLESISLVAAYVVYLISLVVWTKLFKEDQDTDPIEMVEEEIEAEKKQFNKTWYGRLLHAIDTLFRVLPDCEKNPRWTIPIFFISLAGIAGASYFLVVGGEAFALGIGVPSSIVALTILAGGTSVPEMISSAIVAKQGRGDMAISNAIGSNIFDILLSLGLPLLIYTSINGTLETTDTANISSSVILLFATLMMVLLLLISQKFKAGRLFGSILLLSYGLYVIAAFAGFL